MSTLIQLLDRPIAYNPAFAKLKAGKVRAGPVAAVFLSQMVYWHNRMDGGWMYKTQTDIASETALTRDEQETARKRLVALGVLEEERRGVPATMHYRINTERLEALLLETAKPAKKGVQEKTRLRDFQNVETQQSGLVQPRKPDCGNAANKNVETPQTSMGQTNEQVCGDPAIFPTGDYTETTQEITQESKTPSCPDASQPDAESLSPAEKFLARHPDAVTWNLPKRQWGSHDDLTCAQWIWKKIACLYERAAETDGELVRPKEPNWTAWANEIRLMRVQDSRTHKQICELFSRANRDSFWCRNILSPSKLREKWDELSLKLSAAAIPRGEDKSISNLLSAEWNTPEGWRDVL
ncbi:primosomal protein I [Salmonella enterica]|nr:primosomal protein I [Salmonella enterica]EJM2518928.1 primosomal protein I [Salmonella enterica]